MSDPDKMLAYALKETETGVRIMSRIALRSICSITARDRTERSTFLSSAHSSA